MTLNELKDGEQAVVEEFRTQDDLCKRFFSFGLTKGTQIKRIKSTLSGSTIAIELNRSCIALRCDEAKKIKVRKL